MVGTGGGGSGEGGGNEVSQGCVREWHIVPRSPCLGRSPHPAKRSPELGCRMQQTPPPWGCWVAGQQRAHRARAAPRLPWNLGTNGGDSQLLLESGVLPSPSAPTLSALAGILPDQTQPYSAGGTRRQPEPFSAPLPKQRCRGKMGGTVEVKITDPLIKGKKRKSKKIKS